MNQRCDWIERQLEGARELRTQRFGFLHGANDKPRLANKQEKQAKKSSRKKAAWAAFKCLLFLGGWLPSLLFRSFLHSLKVKVFAADQAL